MYVLQHLKNYLMDMLTVQTVITIININGFGPVNFNRPETYSF